jgi:hypothetical protein
MFWLFGYCGICWLVGGLYAQWVWRTAIRLRAQFDIESLETPKGGFLTTRVILFTMAVVLAPMTLPLALLFVAGLFTFTMVKCLCHLQFAYSEAKKYREPQFVLIDVTELDAGYQVALNQLHAEFDSLDFDHYGDFQTKFEPMPVFNLYYWDSLGVVIADITMIDGVCSPGFLSILADGTYIETAGCDPLGLDSPDATDLICVEAMGKLPVPELYRRHLLAIERESQRRDSAPLSFQADQLSDVSIYGQRRFWSWRQASGEQTGPVPAPVLPAGSPTSLDAAGVGLRPTCLLY